MKLRKQFFYGYSLVVLLIAVVGFTGYRTQQAIAESFEEAVNRTQPVLTALEQIRLHATRVGFFAAAQSAPDTAAQAAIKTQTQVQISLLELRAATARYRALVQKYFPDELALSGKLERAVVDYGRLAEALQANGKPQDDMAFHSQLGQLSMALMTLQGMVIEARAAEEREFEQQRAEVESELEHYLVWLVAVLIGSIVTALGLGVWLARRLMRPIEQLRQIALRMGQGHLDARAEVPVRNEIGELAQAFNQMAAELDRTLVKRDYVETIIEFITDGVVVVDMSGTILRRNSAMHRICHAAGMHSSQCSTLTELFANEAIMTSLSDNLQSQRVFESSLKNQTQPGFIVSVSVSPTMNNHSTQERVLLIKDITLQKQMEQKVQQLAFFDPLTRLPNRHMLDDRLGRAMAVSRRSGRYGALMFLDLDNFKPLNDTHGHGVGDLLLTEVAARLIGSVREVDTAARFGGDEFVVLLTELDSDKTMATTQAQVIAEKIRAALARPYLLALNNEGQTEINVEHRCTACIGLVLFPNHEASQEDILKWADMAMYQAKEGGRDRVRFYEPVPHTAGTTDCSSINIGG